MNEISDNQSQYWDRVAGTKTFTHPIDLELMQNYVHKDSMIVDYGCGYGRLVDVLNNAGYTKVKGYDTSLELIKRGITSGVVNLNHIVNPSAMLEVDNSIDCLILFAVLTCIPNNQAQEKLMEVLYLKLKPGGIIYVSDYYLQSHSVEVKQYQCLNDDQENYGVFTLPEGATFRHHPRAWIMKLLADFQIEMEMNIEVSTMNGNKGEAFQLIGRKL